MMSASSACHLEAPVECYVQSAVEFHRRSSYGEFPEPRHPALVLAGDEGQRSTVPHGGERPALGELAGLTAVLAGRKSTRVRAGRCGRAVLERLLAAALGPDAASGRHPYPSAGGLHAVSVLCLLADVADADPEVCRFDGETGRLTRLAGPSGRLPARPGTRLLRTTQVDPGSVQAVVVLVADLAEIGARYGERAYRYALLEAGHMAQNVVLACSLVGLAVCPIGGIDDFRGPELLGVTARTDLCLYGIAIP
jgi:SagB-type dehydrogenase family enzyme